MVTGQRLDCVFDDEPLSFEKDLLCRPKRSNLRILWKKLTWGWINKKAKLYRVCVDFRDLNNATTKDEYPMLVAKMLVDSTAGFEYLSILDCYSGYNQIFIAEEDVSKTTFRCPGDLGTYEWILMPFGLKNVGATHQRAMNSIFHDFIDKFMQV